MKNEAPAIDRLRAIAVRNERATVTPRADGSTVVAVPVSYPRWFSAIASAIGLRTARSFELDGLGAQLFRRIDGASLVIDHIDALAREHRLTFHEARLLVSKYLETLMTRGLVVIVVPGPADAPSRVAPTIPDPPG